MHKNNGTSKHNLTALQDAVSPVLDSGHSLKEMRIILSEMYSNSVSNAPSDELDNFTAKRQTVVFLALQKFLELLQEPDRNQD